MKLTSEFTRTSAEQTWKEFVEWIGFSTLSDALERKHKSLDDWAAFKEMAPRLFSIEYGLGLTLRQWRATRKLWYPKKKSVYDAYVFVGACCEIRKQLSPNQARKLRSRIISDILPNGRLCHLDHEFRTAQHLNEFGWKINHSGFCGDAGCDFVAERDGIEVEIESKCLSPEIGLGVSYEFAARLMSRLGRELRERHSLCLTVIRVEILGHTDETGGVDSIVQHVTASYRDLTDFSSPHLRISVETRSLDEFLTKFSDVKNGTWLQRTFSALRTREGDYGYFIRKNEELIFCNLIPSRTNQQLKKIMKLISATCERQFSKQRPGLLWLHLQGLHPAQMDNDPSGTDHLLQTFARHAFTNDRRNHIAALAFTSDSDLAHEQVHYLGKDRRSASAAGHLKGYDNLRCRFGQIPILAPTFSSTVKNAPS